MALTTLLKQGLNRVLAPANLRVDTLTAERAERRRLDALVLRGYFDHAAFPVPDSFAPPPQGLVDEIRAGATRFEDFQAESLNPVRYSFDNSYFSSPDAEALYGMLRWCRPATYLEVGSGHSTRVARQAVIDGVLDTRIVCIDPSPRRELEGIADELYRRRVEDMEDRQILDRLRSGDVLFIDSSHDALSGSDVTHLFLRILPQLPLGVVVHVHDVFLPYDYPRDWLIEHRLQWNEQYVVAALLSSGSRLQAVWPGFWLQKTWAGFGELLPHSKGRRAQSLWMSVGPLGRV